MTHKILLSFDHGLGDAAQFSCVLKHLQKYRPDWDVTVLTLVGKHSLFGGLCKTLWVNRKDDFWPEKDKLFASGEWDQCIHIDWPECYEDHEGIEPCTKVEKTLREVFDIEPDPDLINRYWVTPSEEADETALRYLAGICDDRMKRGRFPVVLIHYEANTGGGPMKDIPSVQIPILCGHIIRAGYVPVILDWDKRSPFPDWKTIHCPGVYDGDLWGSTGTGDGGVLTAMIDLSSAIIAIDSGPLHCAAATSTPTIAVWREHHPIQFICPAKNILNLVPENIGSIGLGDRQCVRDYFASKYRTQVYRGWEAITTSLFEALGAPRKNGLIKVADFWIRDDNREQDMVIVNDVFYGDCYRTSLLSDGNDPEQVVVDVGAHIGTFARLWHHKNPMAQIFCIEACPENWAALQANVGEFATIFHGACTYETGELMLLNAVRPNCESTGGSTVVVPAALDGPRQHGYQYWEDKREIQRFTLEGILGQDDIDKIDVLKLDCEGSEFSILEGTKSLNKIRMIVGEYHDEPRWEAFRQVRFAGWDYGQMMRDGRGLGLFHYANPVWPPPADCHAVRPGLIDPPFLRVAVPAGIGDSLWTMTKIRSMLKQYGAKKAIVTLCGGPPRRAGDFIERFDFIERAEYSDLSCVKDEWWTGTGTYNWGNSQPRWHNRFDWMLQANRQLESGERLEDWLPEFETDWSVVTDCFRLTLGELQDAVRRRDLGRYALFYFGPYAGKGTGHNRGELWKPADWKKLAERVRSMGIKIVGVGAEWDLNYWEKRLRPAGVPLDDNLIGKTTIGELCALISKAEFLIGYQSGLVNFACYAGVNCAGFWRPHGDSIHEERYVSFSERMATAWAPPEAVDSGRYLPLIYGKCTPESIAEHAKLNWIETK